MYDVNSICIRNIVGINPGYTDFVFLIVGVEDVEGIVIRNLDDLADEGIGEGRYGEKYEENRRN